MRHSCEGNPSITNYGRGCRCDLCKSAKSIYEIERRTKARKYKADHPEEFPSKPKKPAGKRDMPLVMNDAFTREQILEARR